MLRSKNSTKIDVFFDKLESLGTNIEARREYEIITWILKEIVFDKFI